MHVHVGERYLRRHYNALRGRTMPNDTGRAWTAGGAPYSRSNRITDEMRVMVPREGIIRNHRHDEPLFVLSMVA
jgi:hypothetical protein